MPNKRLVYVAGPTAVGKTALSVALAQHFKTEILSCDARQCYQEMTIGTAVPSAEEQQGIPHHFIQNQSIHRHFGAGDFEKAGLKLLDRLFQKHNTVVMVGGSGLYAQALIEGLDVFPKVDQTSINIVSKLFQTEGLEGLQKALAVKDPDYYQKVDLKNPRRLIRALEVCESAQKPYSSFLGQSAHTRPFPPKPYCLGCPERGSMNASTSGWSKWSPQAWKKKPAGFTPIEIFPPYKPWATRNGLPILRASKQRKQPLPKSKKTAVAMPNDK